MTHSAQETVTPRRQRIQVQGIVQGVGFRPFVYRLAVDLGLTGFVRNDGSGVTIEIEGRDAALDHFLTALSAQAPPLAQIDSYMTSVIDCSGESAFRIVESQTDAARNTLISPDVGLCDDCLTELLNPLDRRYRYPFINCTNCGPRFTIVRDTPYDRDKTTMQAFRLCPACEAEYQNPRDRRFHAEPNACPQCGPHLSLLAGDSAGEPGSIPPEQCISETVRLLADGAIVAIKGIGGYHLCCDALNASAVTRLRQRKQREAKPFALMVPDVETAQALCFVSEAEARLLTSRRRPIVLLRQRADNPLAPDTAPRYNTLGVMLPYTPLHVLLLSDFAAQFEPSRPVALVMTSANISDEPIVYRDDEAQTCLAPIADHILTHSRPIQTRCDDSVVRLVGEREQFFRRSRGYVPEPIHLNNAFPAPLLAVGGQLKNTFCVGKAQHAFVSQHIGDLENLETLRAFGDEIEHFQLLFDIQPEIVAYDLHPDYLSSKYALTLDMARKIGVQHHHAHIASVMAEHGLERRLIGIAADGSGYGTDGTVWGGEILLADLRQFERVAHLALVPLPGGEQAVRQPWRMAAVYLRQAYGDDFLKLEIPFVQQLDRKRWHILAQMIERRINSPLTSSMGRLFDAVAALLMLRNDAVYEGQAAVELEMLAQPSDDAYPFALNTGSGGSSMQFDLRPTIRALVEELQRGESAALMAGRFHRTIAEVFVAVCERVRRQSGLSEVALSGGVFQNRLLLEQTLALLHKANFQTYINEQVPPNDGGLSLGQAAVAAATFA
ncbi:MAG: carbamoyltransferase HypF [Chloroflexi bacterium]|nr:carbamoyltransferase HypF [Chloroflexota bacterium]